MNFVGRRRPAPRPPGPAPARPRARPGPVPGAGPLPGRRVRRSGRRGSPLRRTGAAAGRGCLGRARSVAAAPTACCRRRRRRRSCRHQQDQPGPGLGLLRVVDASRADVRPTTALRLQGPIPFPPPPHLQNRVIADRLPARTASIRVRLRGGCCMGAARTKGLLARPPARRRPPASPPVPRPENIRQS
jgi:hypothetical protein